MTDDNDKLPKSRRQAEFMHPASGPYDQDVEFQRQEDADRRDIKYVLIAAGLVLSPYILVEVIEGLDVVLGFSR